MEDSHPDIDDHFPETYAFAPWDYSGDSPDDLVLAAQDLLDRYRSVRLAERTPPPYRNRFHKAMTFNMPFLHKNLAAKKPRILEIGCGKAPKAFPLSLIASEYVGIDLLPGHIRAATKFGQQLGVSNAHFEVTEAADTQGFLDRNADQPFDVIILYAVLEHLTIEEKLGLLETVWSNLAEDGVLYIGETPNRMFGIDYHSSKSLYFQQMPFDLWPHVIPSAAGDDWRGVMLRGMEQGDWKHTAYRRGVHVGHQEFDIGLGPVEELADHVVADGMDPAILNLYSFSWFEFLKLAELRSLGSFREDALIEPRQFPDFFGRYWLEVMLQRGGAERPRPRTEVTWPGITGPASMFEKPLLTVTRDNPYFHTAQRTAGNVALTVQIRNAMRSGPIIVRGRTGTELARLRPRRIVRSFGNKRRGPIAIRLPDIPASEFPVSIAPVEHNVLRLSTIFEH